MMTVAYFASAHQMPTDRWFVPGPLYTVRVIRHTDECYEVEAFGFYGQRIRHRMFAYGRNRRSWALEQARQWADSIYLRLDPVIYC